MVGPTLFINCIHQLNARVTMTLLEEGQQIPTHSKDAGLNEFGPMLVNIDNFAKKMEDVFNFVPRDCNWVAHGLGRHSFVLSHLESWAPYSQIGYCPLCPFINEFSPRS